MKKFFVGCIPGIEDLLLGELNDLGIDSGVVKSGGVQFQGNLKEAYQVCLWSRVASRVLLPIAEFEAHDGDDVYRAALRIPWSDHLRPGATFAVRATLRRNRHHSRFLALRVKDAVADRLRKDRGNRPDVDPNNPDLQLNLHLDGSSGILAIDLAGPPLHQRGYRMATVKAPLRETLAAAILYRCRWPQLAAKGTPFFNPLCGSGTLALEALSMATDQASGLHRKRWGFEGWSSHQAKLWRELYENARQRWNEGCRVLSSSFWALDRSRRAIDAFSHNLDHLGLRDRVHLHRKAFEDWNPRGEPGLLVMNPPYGERLGETQELVSFYDRLGPLLREHYPGWQIAILGPDSELLGKVHLKAFKINRFKNGPIQCRLMQYHVKQR